MPPDIHTNSATFEDGRVVVIGYSPSADEYYIYLRDENRIERKFALSADAAHLISDLVQGPRMLSDALYMRGRVAVSTDAEKWA